MDALIITTSSASARNDTCVITQLFSLSHAVCLSASDGTLTLDRFEAELETICSCKSDTKVIYISAHAHATKGIYVSNQVYISFDLINRYLQCALGCIIIILDCCYAQRVITNAYEIKNNIPVLVNPKLCGLNIICFSSCRRFEKCLTFMHKTNGPVGVFTYLFAIAWKKGGSILKVYKTVLGLCLKNGLESKPTLSVSNINLLHTTIL